MSNDNKTVEDVRNLIVCDTQFGWTGSTTLRLQQMLALQERGWLVEGAENNEFDLTDAGREVVARALQAAVQPTLADVQPGGRVRLGDHAERARFEAWAEPRKHTLTRWGDSPGDVKPLFVSEVPGNYISPAAQAAWEAWQHLAAQPSPGGQGETLVTDAMVMAALQAVTRETLAGVGDCDSKVIGVLTAYGIDGAVDIPTMVRAMMEAALAARQPVYVQGCDELRARTEGERAAYMEGLEEGKKIAARQPVGEPVCSGGFVISNGSGEKYMAWGQVGPEWTADRSAALWLVRRADAEALAAENEDAWSILPVERCAMPPNGWACTLAAGHEGPCPTIAAPPGGTE